MTQNYRPAHTCGNCQHGYYDHGHAGQLARRRCRLYNSVEVVRFYVCDAWEPVEGSEHE